PHCAAVCSVRDDSPHQSASTLPEPARHPPQVPQVDRKARQGQGQAVAAHTPNPHFVSGGNGLPLALARLPVYLWDLGRVPIGLPQDAIGFLGRFGADVANRCAVGTSAMLKVLGSRERGAVPSIAASGTAPRSPLPL